MNVQRQTRGTSALLAAVAAFVTTAPPLIADRAEARPAPSPTLLTRPRAPGPGEAARNEAAFVADINRLRASQGVRLLEVRPNLTRKARSWAATMATARGIRHSRLSAGVPGNWRKLGENVGKGPSEPRLHAAFVSSPTHLQNLIDPAFRYIGVGVVSADGIMYVSQVFMEPAPAKARPRAFARYATAKPALAARRAHQWQSPRASPSDRPPLLFRPIQ
jgi:uncharacterized protein YkwD